MNNLIITHSGKAHFDEFLAVSLIIAVHSDTIFSIERRRPTREELEDPDTWVVDVGQRYKKELKNFDHHQDLQLSASYVLVADYLNLTDRLAVSSWWQYKDKIDRFGPVMMAKEFGIQSIRPGYSPVESWFLDLFAENPESVYPLLHSFGEYIIREADHLVSRFKFWEECETIKIKDKIVLVGLTNDATGIQRYGEQKELPPVVSVTYDRRGDGWKLTRINDAPQVDFSVLEGHEDISFAHKSGFMAKTKKRIPIEEVLKLVESAIA